MRISDWSSDVCSSVLLDADALAALDSFAVGRGGRSAVVRQMIEQSVQEIADRPHIDRPDGAARNRVTLRFTDVEIAVIAHRALQRSTDRAGWIKELVRDRKGVVQGKSVYERVDLGGRVLINQKKN